MQKKCPNTRQEGVRLIHSQVRHWMKEIGQPHVQAAIALVKESLSPIV